MSLLKPVPPMPSGREVRPPAPGRVAHMSTLTGAFGTPTSIQASTLPTSLSRNKAKSPMDESHGARFTL